ARIRRVSDDPGARGGPAGREAALEAAGGLSYWLGDMTTTMASYEGALGLARSNGDPRRISHARYNPSFTWVWAKVAKRAEERAAKGKAEIEEALALARQVGDRGAIARCLW